MKLRRHVDRGRPGVVLLLAVVMVGTCGFCLSLLVTSQVRARQVELRAERRGQADWLAQSALELGAARSLANPNYVGEVWEPSPEYLAQHCRATARITLRPDLARPGRKILAVTVAIGAADQPPLEVEKALLLPVRASTGGNP